MPDPTTRSSCPELAGRTGRAIRSGDRIVDGPRSARRRRSLLGFGQIAPTGGHLAHLVDSRSLRCPPRSRRARGDADWVTQTHRPLVGPRTHPAQRPIGRQACAVAIRIRALVSRTGQRNARRDRPYHRLAHRRSRLLAIVDPPPGPVTVGLAVVGPVSRDLPADCSPGRFGRRCQPPRARFRMNVRNVLHKRLLHQLRARLQDLSTNSWAVWIERGEDSRNRAEARRGLARGA
jgi:hypothetical protein